MVWHLRFWRNCGGNHRLYYSTSSTLSNNAARDGGLRGWSNPVGNIAGGTDLLGPGFCHYYCHTLGNVSANQFRNITPHLTQALVLRLGQ